MGQHTFIPESEVPSTPFNTRLPSAKRLKMSTKGGKKTSIDEATLGMANTIQSISQKNARMWQIIALVSLSSFFISLGICIYAVNLPKTVPIIVTVDGEGRAEYTGRVDTSYNASSKIPESAKTYQIKKLIGSMYTWSLDPAAQRAYIKDCETICAGNVARGQLNNFFLENNPFDNMGVTTQVVEIGEPMALTSRSYNVLYRTERFSYGHIEKVEYWSAVVTIDIMDGDRNENPLGVYVTSIDIKADKTGAAKAAESGLKEVNALLSTINTVTSGSQGQDTVEQNTTEEGQSANEEQTTSTQITKEAKQ